MNTVVSTVLISALVSGVVAIGIELVAKPRMDARKERILNDHRNRRKFEDNLLRLRVMSGMWTESDYPENLTVEQRERVEGEIERTIQRMDDVTREMVDDLGFYALTYLNVRIPRVDTTMPKLISRYAYAVRGVQLSERSFKVKAKILHELTVPIHTYLFGSKWHPSRRINALVELPKLLDKYTSAGGSEPVVQPGDALDNTQSRQ